MKIPRPHFTSRASVLATFAIAAALGVTGWALAEGDLPLLSSTDSATATTTTTVGGSQGANTDNVAVATNTKDGKDVFALSLKIAQTDDSTVDPVNAAVAVASCTDCQTVAIALEAVLVVGSPTTFEPTNIALAINSECSSCQTLAAAYQKTVQNDTRVRISGAGRREIAAIRTDLLSLRNSGLDIVTIQARVEEAASRFLRVLDTEVYPIGPSQPEASATSAPPSTPATTATATEPTTSTTVSTTTTTVESTTTTVP